MRSLVLVALMTAAAIPAKAGEAPAASMVAQDPLMRQIRKRMMEPDGGFQSVTWVRGQNGQRTAIPMVDRSAAEAALSGAAAQGAPSPSALNGLAADRRLTAARLSAARAVHGYKGRVRAPTKQLRRIEEQKGWQQ